MEVVVVTTLPAAGRVAVPEAPAQAGGGPAQCPRLQGPGGRSGWGIFRRSHPAVVIPVN